jgi:hypothetical protein
VEEAFTGHVADFDVVTELMAVLRTVTSTSRQSVPGVRARGAGRRVHERPVDIDEAPGAGVAGPPDVEGEVAPGVVGRRGGVGRDEAPADHIGPGRRRDHKPGVCLARVHDGAGLNRDGDKVRALGKGRRADDAHEAGTGRAPVCVALTTAAVPVHEDVAGQTDAHDAGVRVKRAVTVEVA